MTFGQKIKSLRQRAGLTKNELASRCSVSFVSIFGYERDAMTPSLGVALRLLRELGEPVHVLEGCKLRTDSRMRDVAKEDD